MKLIKYKDKLYPNFQTEGNAARFIMPFALEFCEGVGYDIGCNRLQWMLSPVGRTVIPIDPAFQNDHYTQHQQIRNGWDKFGFKNYFYIDNQHIIQYNADYHATSLPDEKYGEVDFIFSSHCLEHIESPWYKVLEYWKSNIKSGGVMFLYLPDYSQEYWRPWNNPKHIHIFTPEIMRDAFEALGMKNVFITGVDLNNSFAIVGEV